MHSSVHSYPCGPPSYASTVSGSGTKAIMNRFTVIAHIIIAMIGGYAQECNGPGGENKPQ